MYIVRPLIVNNKYNCNHANKHLLAKVIVRKYPGKGLWIIWFNPIWPSLFWPIRDLGGGGGIVPPPPPKKKNIFGLGGLRVPILFGNDLRGGDLPYSKGFMKFECPERPQKMFHF